MKNYRHAVFFRQEFARHSVRISVRINEYEEETEKLPGEENNIRC